MNFYKRYMADYAKKTARLTLAQHGAYTLLLDELYGTERPLPQSYDELNRICRAMIKAEQEAVKFVADQYFPVCSDGLRHNNRATEELARHKVEVQSAREFWGSFTQAERSAMRARARAARLDATPAWLTKKDIEDIDFVYSTAAKLTDETGIPHEVDHIVPLQGKKVCGLHVAWNLEAIPASVNRAKGNKHG